MPIVRCQICDKAFYIKPNRLARGWGKYCSNQCKHIGKKNGKQIACTVCGQLTYKVPKDIARSRSGKLFCSKSCQTIWRNSKVYIGDKHPNWKSGETAYRGILKRTGSAQICARCLTNDTRLLAVHHRDRNRQNNNPANLLWLCHNCHHLVHHYPEESRGYIT